MICINWVRARTSSLVLIHDAHQCSIGREWRSRTCVLRRRNKSIWIICSLYIHFDERWGFLFFTLKNYRLDFNGNVFDCRSPKQIYCQLIYRLNIANSGSDIWYNIKDETPWTILIFPKLVGKGAGERSKLVVRVGKRKLTVHFEDESVFERYIECVCMCVEQHPVKSDIHWSVYVQLVGEEGLRKGS